MQKILSRRPANFLGFLVCCGLMAYALYAQYVQFLEPCNLCLFQRFAVIGIGIAFLLAALHHPGKIGAKIYAVLIGVLALIGVGIAGWHLWIQAQPPGSVPSCGAGVSYMFQIMPVFDVIKKVFSGSGECQHVDTILGISWPWWTATAMAGLGVWGVRANWKAS